MSTATISPLELAALCRNGEPLELIDVRTPAEFGEVHVNTARNVPLDRLDPAELAAVDTEYVLVLDSSGRITGFNQHGRALLAEEMRTNWRGATCALGKPFSDFFDCEIDSLTRFAAPQAIERNVIRLSATGRSLFIQVVPPATIRVRHTPPPQEDCKLPPPLKAVAGGVHSIPLRHC